MEGENLLNLYHILYLFICDIYTDGASELPLWGSFCARLAAQPKCLVEDTVAGYLHVQPESCEEWQHLYCVLRNLQLTCWNSQEDHQQSQSQPHITIPITKVCLEFQNQFHDKHLKGN